MSREHIRRSFTALRQLSRVRRLSRLFALERYGSVLTHAVRGSAARREKRRLLLRSCGVGAINVV
jgi:hypothetical protein